MKVTEIEKEGNQGHALGDHLELAEELGKKIGSFGLGKAPKSGNQELTGDDQNHHPGLDDHSGNVGAGHVDQDADNDDLVHQRVSNDSEGRNQSSSPGQVAVKRVGDRSDHEENHRDIGEKHRHGGVLPARRGVRRLDEGQEDEDDQRQEQSEYGELIWKIHASC